MSLLHYFNFHGILQWIGYVLLFQVLLLQSFNESVCQGIVVWGNSKYASSKLTVFGILAIREHRLFGSLWAYVSFMIVNLFLRFVWILTLLPQNMFGEDSTSFGSILLYHLGPMIACFEVLRRMVWGFYRLEYEQIEVFGKVEKLSENVSLSIMN